MSYNFLDKTGLTYFWSKIKDKIENNRKVAKVGYTGSGNPTWYFPLVDLPKDSAGDYASFQIDGRLGGYSGTSMSKYSIMITNRTSAYTGVDITSAVLQFLNGSQTSCDIVAYAQEDKSAKVYIKANGYFLFDFLYQNYQGTITYNGEYQTAEPDGTLVWSLSTAKKIYINNNGQLIGDITSSQISDRKNMTTAGSIDWTSQSADDKLITNNTLAYWNGAYNDTGNSNIEYVKAGKISAQTAYSNKGNAQTVPKITTNSLGQVTSITDVTIEPTTLQTLTYNRNGGSNPTWAKVATTTVTGTYQEKHAFLFIKGSHNTNYNENGILALDAIGNATTGAVSNYRARFMSATPDLNLENFYIETINNGDNSIVNFWIKDGYNGYQSWQVKILQNSGWTITSNNTSVSSLPTEGYTGKNAELFGASLTSEQDGEGNNIVDTYATKQELTDTTLDDLAVISSKQYTGIYGSANNQANASFYFANVRPGDFYSVWKVRYRITAEIPDQNNYRQYSDVTWYGNQNTVSYSNYNRLYSTNYRCYRYHNIYSLKSAGFISGYSHVLGVGLRDATNPTNSSYPRTIRVEILETENCSVTLLDNMVKVADLPGYGSTNYNGVTETNGGDSGLLETNDSINIWQLRHSSGTYLCFSNLYRYQICFSKSENVLLPANAVDNTTATTKTLTTEEFNPFGQILYHNSTTTKNSGATVGGDVLYQQSGLDLRYSFNTGTTLTSGKDVFIKCDPQSNGMVKLDPTTPIVQVLPTTEDGKVYIYLGHTYSNYQVELHATHPVYEYKDGALRLYKGPSEEIFTDADRTKLDSFVAPTRTTLYTNSLNTANVSWQTITLSQAYTNFDEIEINYGYINSDSNLCWHKETMKVRGTTDYTTLHGGWWSSATTLNVQEMGISFNGTTVQVQHVSSMDIKNGATSATSGGKIVIKEIIGIKEL